MDNLWDGIACFDSRGWHKASFSFENALAEAFWYYFNLSDIKNDVVWIFDLFGDRHMEFHYDTEHDLNPEEYVNALDEKILEEWDQEGYEPFMYDSAISDFKALNIILGKLDKQIQERSNGRRVVWIKYDDEFIHLFFGTNEELEDIARNIIQKYKHIFFAELSRVKKDLKDKYLSTLASLKNNEKNNGLYFLLKELVNEIKHEICLTSTTTSIPTQLKKNHSL